MDQVQFRDYLRRIAMSCYICGTRVTPVVLPDSEEIPCPECGRYRITGTATELLKRNILKFDIYLSRRWLADQQGSGIIPLIDSNITGRLMQH